jgi:serine phosphatase RsbU (regulator of sigma subunit)
VEQICNRLVESVENFAGMAPQADDITVLTVDFGPPSLEILAAIP